MGEAKRRKDLGLPPRGKQPKKDNPKPEVKPKSPILLPPTMEDLTRATRLRAQGLKIGVTEEKTEKKE